MKNFIKNFTNTGSKLGVVLFLGALFSAPANALMSFGIKGGLNVSNATYSSGGVAVPYAFAAGSNFMGGLSLDADAGPIGVVVDALYTKRRIVYGVGASNPLYYFDSSSLFVPVQAKLTLIPLLSLTAGGYYSIPIAKSKIYTPAGIEARTQDGESDYGAVGGISVNLAMLSLEARYNFGLKNQDDSPNVIVKTRSIDFLLGYRF